MFECAPGVGEGGRFARHGVFLVRVGSGTDWGLFVPCGAILAVLPIFDLRQRFVLGLVDKFGRYVYAENQHLNCRVWGGGGAFGLVSSHRHSRRLEVESRVCPVRRKPEHGDNGHTEPGGVSGHGA